MAQLADIEIDGQPMRAQKMAELVVSGRREPRLVRRRVDPEPEHAPPLTGTKRPEFARPPAARRGPAVRPGALPSAAPAGGREIRRLHEVAGGHARNRSAGRQRRAAAAAGHDAGSARRRPVKLLAAVEAAAVLAYEIEETGEPWTVELRMKCRLADLASRTRRARGALRRNRRAGQGPRGIPAAPVEMPEAGAGAAEGARGGQPAAETGKPFGFMAFGAGEVEGAGRGQLQVAGLRASGGERLEARAPLPRAARAGALRSPSAGTSSPSCSSVPEVEGGVAGSAAHRAGRHHRAQGAQAGHQHDAHAAGEGRGACSPSSDGAAARHANELAAGARAPAQST